MSDLIAEPLFAIAAILVVYGAVSGVLSRSVVSAPMVFMLVGLLVGPGVLGLIDVPIDSAALEGFGEVTLGLILFADAASTNSRRLLSDNRIPLRLLLIALPLTIAFGAAVAHYLFPDLSWAECVLIAAILAPTDAALGVTVVTSKFVPERVRQAVLVESGLNDGLALPAVLLFAALSFGMADGHGSAETGSDAQGLAFWLQFAGQQILIGGLAGVIGGGVMGFAINRADKKGWIEHSFRSLTTIGVALIILFSAHFVGGNGFIATFVGGLIFGAFRQSGSDSLTDFVEEEGQLFSLLIFFFFGAVLLPDAAPYFTVYCVSYGLLSLTIIRMLPSLVALVGAKVSLPGQLFIGWFGPRGLASILFLFIAVEHDEMSRLSQIEAIVYVTVFLSIMLHGATASPLSNRYGASNAGARDGSG